MACVTPFLFALLEHTEAATRYLASLVRTIGSLTEGDDAGGEVLCYHLVRGFTYSV